MRRLVAIVGMTDSPSKHRPRFRLSQWDSFGSVLSSTILHETPYDVHYLECVHAVLVAVVRLSGSLLTSHANTNTHTPVYRRNDDLIVPLLSIIAIVVAAWAAISFYDDLEPWRGFWKTLQRSAKARKRFAFTVMGCPSGVRCVVLCTVVVFRHVFRHARLLWLRVPCQHDVPSRSTAVADMMSALQFSGSDCVHVDLSRLLLQCCQRRRLINRVTRRRHNQLRSRTPGGVVLSSLPDTVLVHIALFLHRPDILRMRFVSARWARVMGSDRLWLQKFQTVFPEVCGHLHVVMHAMSLLLLLRVIRCQHLCQPSAACARVF